MSDDPIIIDIIAEHRCRQRGMVCDEGEVWCDACKCIVNADNWAAHMLTALRRKGVAVVQLPEVLGQSSISGRQYFPAGHVYCVYPQKCRQVSVFGKCLTTETARALAAALLAAANHADGVDHE